MTLTLVVSDAARVYANIVTHRDAFFAYCMEAHAALSDRYLNFMVPRWACGVVEVVSAENHNL